MLRGGEVADSGHQMGRSTLIVGDRALLAICLVVFVALLLHTAFWSFVLPYGALVS